MKTTSQAHSASSVPPYRWCYLALSSFGLLFVGIIYAWSIFKVPLQDAFGWDAPSLAVNYSLSVAFLCIGGLVGGLLDKKLSTRSLLLMAAVLSFVGFTVTSRLDGSNITLLYIAYGIVAGSGIGISYNTLLAVGNSWFPDKKGLSSGILMMCFGLSTMLLGKVAAAMFEMEAFGWRKTFFFVGAIIAVILVICALLLKKPGADVVFPTAPEKTGKSKTKTSGSATNKVADSAYVKASATQSSSAKPISQCDYTAAETMRSPAFWIFFVYGTLTCSVGMVVINFALDLSLTLGASVALATTLVGVLSACNGLGRIGAFYPVGASDRIAPPGCSWNVPGRYFLWKCSDIKLCIPHRFLRHQGLRHQLQCGQPAWSDRLLCADHSRVSASVQRHLCDPVFTAFGYFHRFDPVKLHDPQTIRPADHDFFADSVTFLKK